MDICTTEIGSTKDGSNQVIELKAIKINKDFSEETLCYKAKLYVDGKFFAHIENEGRGGGDSQFPTDPYTYEDLKKLDEKCKKYLPKWEYSLDAKLDGDTKKCDTDLEHWCWITLDKYQIYKEYQRDVKSKVLIVDPKEPKKIRQFSWKGVRKITDRYIQSIRDKFPTYKILNTESDGFETYYNLLK